MARTSDTASILSDFSRVADEIVLGDASSNTFRCRHLQAISLRNLIIASADNDHEEPPAHIPAELSQILSDEEVLSSDEEASVQPHDATISQSRGGVSPNGSPILGPVSKARLPEKGTGSAASKKALISQRKRPAAKRQISRSMSTAFAEARLRAYEDRILSRRVTAFFSLHRLTGKSEIDESPIYISEVQSTAMNPDFRPFPANETQDQLFLRSRSLIIRIWAKTADQKDFRLLVEEAVVLPELRFVSRELDYAEGDFKNNTVLYHLPDGIYAAYSSESFERRTESAKSKLPEAKTASFDSLMRLRTLVEVIEDATETQQKVAEQIEAILKETGGRKSISQNAGVQDSLRTIRDAVSRTGRDVTRLKYERDMKRKRIESRNIAFAQSNSRLTLSALSASKLKAEAATVGQDQTVLSKDIRSHSARIAEDLLTIFPIEPIPEEPMSFTICGCHCPHAKVYERTHPPPNEAEVAAALGFAATIVDAVSRTLLLHVPYTVQPLGSNSTVRDDITAAVELEQNRLLPPGASASQAEEDGARVFPLYAKSADPARFRYAVYLLNRDIEELVTKQGLRVIDVRDTLANVGFLLHSIAGTTRDLPQREAGKVKAFHDRR